jgi:charged multivesicular body protein 6
MILKTQNAKLRSRADDMGGNQSKGSHHKHPKNTKASITEIDKAILDLKLARDKLDRYRKKIDVDSKRLLQRSQNAYSTGQHTIAVGLLRLRAFKLKEIDSVHNQLLTIAQLTTRIESKDQEKDVILALTGGKNALEKLHSMYSLQDIVQLMDEVHEQQALEREINNILINAGENSLTSLQESEIEAEYLTLSQAADLSLPDVPTGSLPNTHGTKAPGIVTGKVAMSLAS